MQEGVKDKECMQVDLEVVRRRINYVVVTVDLPASRQYSICW